MIKGLFETHLFVEDLQRSMNFYSQVLQLELCYHEPERKTAFYWIGKSGQAMLGLWQKPKEEVQRRHFAFECEPNFILNEAVAFLKSHQLSPYNFLKDGSELPMVFAWMPAVAIYFLDPDGHYLEFIAMLTGPAQPELGIISFDNWKKANQAV